jgi:hypothetical protein
VEVHQHEHLIRSRSRCARGESYDFFRLRPADRSSLALHDHEIRVAASKGLLADGARTAAAVGTEQRGCERGCCLLPAGARRADEEVRVKRTVDGRPEQPDGAGLADYPIEDRRHRR